MIFIIWAPPREGKTYFATSLVLQQLRRGVSCFTNYPVISGDLSSNVWTDDLMYESVQDSVIVIDEAYRSFNSRNYKQFGVDRHTFFATNGHNGLDIYLIAQNPARIDVVIREMTNVFYRVQKFNLPFVQRPFLFRVTGYLSEAAMARGTRSDIYSREYLLFRRRVADAYDTHYYRRKSEPFETQTWAEKFAIGSDGLNVGGSNDIL